MFQKVFYRDHVWADKVNISMQFSSSLNWVYVPHRVYTYLRYESTSYVQHQAYAMPLIWLTCVTKHLPLPIFDEENRIFVAIVDVVVAVMWLNIWREFCPSRMCLVYRLFWADASKFYSFLRSFCQVTHKAHTNTHTHTHTSHI